MSEQTNETATTQEKPANVYKTSKTTWIILGILAVVAIVVVILMMKKGKGEEGVTAGDNVSSTEAPAEMRVAA